MPRVVKAAEVRRNEILDAAYRLFVRHGYEATTVNLIISELGLSKGAFYHHFASKEEVVEALARRMAEEMRERLGTLLSQPGLSPLDKLQLLFSAGAQFKKQHVPMVQALADIYVRDENLRLRTRMTAEAVSLIAPIYAAVLDEGARSGVFAIDDPVETAQLLIHLGTWLQEGFGDVWKLAATDERGAVKQFRRRVAAYERALERILGIAENSFEVLDARTMRLFLRREGR